MQECFNIIIIKTKKRRIHFKSLLVHLVISVQVCDKWTKIAFFLQFPCLPITEQTVVSWKFAWVSFQSFSERNCIQFWLTELTNCITISTGEWDAATATEPFGALEYNVARIFVHPQYTASNLRNNVAILRLATSVVLGQVCCLKILFAANFFTFCSV